jgi:hypothetical protein
VAHLVYPADALQEVLYCEREVPRGRQPRHVQDDGVREDAFPCSCSAGWQLAAAEGLALLYVVVCEALNGGDLQACRECVADMWW